MLIVIIYIVTVLFILYQIETLNKQCTYLRERMNEYVTVEMIPNILHVPAYDELSSHHIKKNKKIHE